MKKKILHTALRLGLGICLFLSQVMSSRSSFFSENPYMIFAGIAISLAGIFIIILASLHMHRAVRENKIAETGPYKYIRHPIYTGIYIFSAGLGLIFFTWLWFIVMLAFMPLWYVECRGEEKEMIKAHGQEYIDYRQRTGIFLPKL